MKLNLRFVYPMDIDLVSIRLNEKRKFSREVRECLKSTLSNQKSNFRFSDIEKPLLDEIIWPVYVSIHLKPGRDDEIIDFINQIPKGSRNYVVKAILRSYIGIYPIKLLISVINKKNATESKKRSDKKTSPQPVLPKRLRKIPIRNLLIHRQTISLICSVG